MNARRMREARDKGERLQKFVPSAKTWGEQQAAIDRKANAIFGLGGVAEGVADGALEAYDDAQYFDEWPGEPRREVHRRDTYVVSRLHGPKRTIPVFDFMMRQ